MKAKKLLGKSSIDTMYECLYLLCTAEFMGKEGSSIDFEGIELDVDIIKDDFKKELFYLVNEGYIVNIDDSIIEDLKALNVTPEKYPYIADLNIIKDKKLYAESTEEGYDFVWTTEYVTKETYGEEFSYYKSYTILSTLLVSLTSFHILQIMRGAEPNKSKLLFKFKMLESQNMYIYIPILSLMETIDYMSDYVDVDYVDNGKLDINYEIFCIFAESNGHTSPDYGFGYSLQEKHNLIKKFNFVENGIYAIYNRTKISKHRPYGFIASASIVMIKEILDDAIIVSQIPLGKSKAELYVDYMSLDDETKYLMSDILSKKPVITTAKIDLYTLGIEDYFGRGDSNLLCKIDKNTKVEKLIYINNMPEKRVMREVDAIYWLLSEYEIPFNKELYKETYFSKLNIRPTWDIVQELEKDFVDGTFID